ncbi:hypothetical protein IYY11_01070 [Methylocystis sp. H62]|uniref:Uncharacterized protein n=1 Tax=Methylocystis rosea TaxID=173366 RepID=A0ABX6EQX5_9HYPH|nr:MULTISPECIES: hypothetical protein [Methylocystis]MBG0792077.1 hypothetical protein [Methylocystis sp. H62]MBG0797222.1 hypothetical protein [Methylocystis sp. L43]MBG0804200.1 hypothetical protein [Methylocystis sp. H15]QGM95992.1 hypothetical protein F7D13_18125 [Methylocystis rosea]
MKKNAINLPFDLYFIGPHVAACLIPAPQHWRLAMSEEIKKLTASKEADLFDSAKLLKQLHDEILAHINLAHTKKFDELITKMSSSTHSLT